MYYLKNFINIGITLRGYMQDNADLKSKLIRLESRILDKEVELSRCNLELAKRKFND